MFNDLLLAANNSVVLADLTSALIPGAGGLYFVVASRKREISGQLSSERSWTPETQKTIGYVLIGISCLYLVILLSRLSN